jgi:hypothetical protein
MLIQLHLNPTDARAAKAYRLQVKERLYRFNYVSADNYSIMCLLFLCERLVFVNALGLTGSVYAGSTCPARGEGPFREARRDVSERSRRLSENIGDVAVMSVSVSSGDKFRVASRNHSRFVCHPAEHISCSTPHGHSRVFQRRDLWICPIPRPLSFLLSPSQQTL